MTLVKVNNPLTKSFNGMMNDFFNDFPTTLGKTVREDVLHFPPVNIHETADVYYMELAAPGFEKADFNVKLEENLLTISTERNAESTENNGKVIRREFSSKSFKRSFTIDDKIEAQNITAKYEQGILKLELPKKEMAKAISKEINIL